MNRIRRHLLVLVGAALVAAGAASSIGVAAPRPTPLQQANALLAQMTRDEKISLVANGGAGVPRLGIPALAPSDGPNGVRNGSPPRTAFPNAQVLAASWDTTLAQRFGVAVGDEAVAKGFNILLGPTVNILRTPLWGRAAETLGEDRSSPGKSPRPRSAVSRAGTSSRRSSTTRRTTRRSSVTATSSTGSHPP